MTNPDNIVRVRARNGGRASVYEANGWAQAYTSGLLKGTGVVQNTVADMHVLVGGSATKPDVVLAENASGYKMALDLIGQQPLTITTPASNSRISAIVAYTDDLALATTEDSVTGSPASCGLIVVNGTASATPSAPNDTAIRSAITADGATGSQAAYCVIATILVANDTTAITDSLITMNLAQIGSDNIDFTTLKKWIPDYSNVSSTNLWSSNSSTTIAQEGFVVCNLSGYKLNANVDISITANGVVVARAVSEARNPNNAVTAATSALLPVATGDIISYDLKSASTNYKTCYFVPGKWT